MRVLGFKNLGNTCYLNSVLQCIVYNSDFIQFILKSNNNIGIIEYLSSILPLIDLTLKEDQDQVCVVNTRKLISIIVSEKPWFNGFEQNDAHEFLSYLLDILIEKTKKVSKALKLKFDDECHTNWYEFLVKNNSQIARDYYGQSKTIITCCNCENKSTVYDQFSSINLVVPLSKEPVKLVELIKQYLTKEKHTDDNNLYKCDKCNLKSYYTKKNVLWKLPCVFIIVLKRYTHNGINKINTIVNIPTKNLSIEDMFLKKKVIYKLTGVVNHYGLQIGGHYNSNINLNDQWVNIDDTIVTKIKKEDLDCKNSYILFYTKV